MVVMVTVVVGVVFPAFATTVVLTTTLAIVFAAAATTIDMAASTTAAVSTFVATATAFVGVLATAPATAAVSAFVAAAAATTHRVSAAATTTHRATAPTATAPSALADKRYGTGRGITFKDRQRGCLCRTPTQDKVASRVPTRAVARVSLVLMGFLQLNLGSQFEFRFLDQRVRGRLVAMAYPRCANLDQRVRGRLVAMAYPRCASCRSRIETGPLAISNSLVRNASVQSNGSGQTRGNCVARHRTLRACQV